MPIICLFGPDGSGKSTLAKALAKRLSNEIFQVKILWMRGTHTLASLFARLFSQFGGFKGVDNPYYEISVPRNLKRFWQILEFASLLPVLIIKFLPLSILGYIVVAERYLPDSIVWIATTTKDPNYQESIAAKFLKTLTLKAKVKIYVTAKPETLLKRRSDIDPSFLQDQLELYEKIAGSVKAFRLDTTNRSIKESADVILNFVKATL
jgi:thymidylate kinase